jgi:ditrans,polycis-polyprenyl diphosphate synthase
MLVSDVSFPPLQSGMKRLQNSCIAAIRRGPVPQHIAIIMDGNRRYARSNRMDSAEGHYSGAEALKNVQPPLCILLEGDVALFSWLSSRFWKRV